MAWWLRCNGEQDFELAQAAVRAADPVDVGHALHESGYRLDERGLRLRRSDDRQGRGGHDTGSKDGDGKGELAHILIYPRLIP